MKRFLFFILMNMTFGCKASELIHIYSPNKQQCLTLITYGDIQYLIDGEYYDVPDTNYIKLDISEKDIEVDHSVHICWGDSNEVFLWDVVINGAIVIERKIDDTKYQFNTELPKRNKIIPTEEKFRNDNCAVVSLILKRPSPSSKTTVVYR